ncbi:hypothetical protein [Streptomyces sp. NPDC058766]|uniref:hypothetical protein n=1 Tax=Streptomyces sp. NPDC058766 TaxID=3346630 RepID=UPI0036BFF9BA
MTADQDAAFTLPRGATGFFRPEDGPLPETDPRAFRAALYAAAGAARGRAREVEEQACPRSFHTTVTDVGGGEYVVLCHAHHPRSRPPGNAGTGEPTSSSHRTHGPAPSPIRGSPCSTAHGSRFRSTSRSTPRSTPRS